MLSSIVVLSLLAPVRQHGEPPGAERIFTDSPPTWVVPLPEVRISPDAKWASFGSGRWRKIVDLETRLEAPERASEFPDALDVRTSPDGSRVASYSGSTVTVGKVDYPLDGEIRALEWSHDGSVVLALVTHDDGSSSLLGIQDGVETLVRDLDAPLRANTIGVVPGGESVYLALASAGSIDLSARHDPDAERDLGLYEVDLATGARELVIDTPMDELSPKVAGGDLYWTRIDYRQSIVVLPIEGGAARLVAEDGQLPYWRNDGRAIGYTVGLPLASDAPLNMDATWSKSMRTRRRARLPGASSVATTKTSRRRGLPMGSGSRFTPIDHRHRFPPITAMARPMISICSEAARAPKTRFG